MQAFKVLKCPHEIHTKGNGDSTLLFSLDISGTKCAKENMTSRKSMNISVIIQASQIFLAVEVRDTFRLMVRQFQSLFLTPLSSEALKVTQKTHAEYWSTGCQIEKAFTVRGAITDAAFSIEHYTIHHYRTLLHLDAVSQGAMDDPHQQLTLATDTDWLMETSHSPKTLSLSTRVYIRPFTEEEPLNPRITLDFLLTNRVFSL